MISNSKQKLLITKENIVGKENHTDINEFNLSSETTLGIDTRKQKFDGARSHTQSEWRSSNVLLDKKE